VQLVRREVADRPRSDVIAECIATIFLGMRES